MASPGDPLRSPRTSHPALGPYETVESPEQVRLDLELAGPMSRAFAFSIDYSLVLLLMTLLVLLFVSGSQQLLQWFAGLEIVQEAVGWVQGWFDEPELSEQEVLERGFVLFVSAWIFIDLFLTILYFLFFETLFQGRTPGKRWTHLRVVTVDGGVLGWRESLLRNLMRAADALPVGYLVGILAMLFSPRVQRLGDLVAGTLVIRERDNVVSDVVLDVKLPPQVEDSFRFTRDELARIGEVERRLIRRTLRRAESLSDRAAGPIVARTTQAISVRIGRGDLLAGSEQRDFLMALLQACERLD